MSPRIGIVGAGPGGLSLARLLTEKGFADVTVIERADRVGGKSMTVFHEGLGHELGTCYVALGYVTVKAWMEEAGIGLFVLENQKIRTMAGELVDFKAFVEEPSGLLGTAAQSARYLASWLRFHDWDARGGPDDGEGTRGRPMREEVAEPFGAWLDARGLDLVGRFALRSMGVMGYGSLDHVPALYGLRWNMPSLLATGALTQIAEPVPGWQPLWTHLAGQLDVRMRHTISAVERTAGGFLVHTNQGDLTFDHLVITTPLDEAAAWFPFDDAERRAFAVDTGELGWHEFVSTLAEVKGWYRDTDTWCAEERVKDVAAVARGQLLGARRTGDKSQVSQARSATRPDVYVCYQYGDPSRTSEQQIETLRADLAAEGATLTQVLRHCRWKYSPQLTPAAIRSGAVARLEHQQGHGNLWISGATASHETVDNIVDYNLRLVERMALAFEGADPSTQEALDGIAERFRFSVGDK
jgi:predicted NAD/FAD-dependent oxidoreductase